LIPQLSLLYAITVYLWKQLALAFVLADKIR
jgi:hypothetical protein